MMWIWSSRIVKILLRRLRSEVNTPMFNSTLPMPPRGFVGRPLIALLFAVGMGILASHVGSWFHLNDLTVTAIALSPVGLVAYLWDRLDSAKEPKTW